MSTRVPCPTEFESVQKSLGNCNSRRCADISSTAFTSLDALKTYGWANQTGKKIVKICGVVAAPLWHFTLASELKALTLSWRVDNFIDFPSFDLHDAADFPKREINAELAEMAIVDETAPSLPYHEPGIRTILLDSSFLLLLNVVNFLLDKTLYCGLLGQVFLGVAFGTPGAKWLTTEVEHVIVQLGYLGLLLLVFEGNFPRMAS